MKLVPGDSLQFDATALHGIEAIEEVPVSYLSVVFTMRDSRLIRSLTFTRMHRCRQLVEAVGVLAWLELLVCCNKCSIAWAGLCFRFGLPKINWIASTSLTNVISSEEGVCATWRFFAASFVRA